VSLISCSLTALPIRANLLNRVPYLDSAYPAAHTVQPTAICSICWTMAWRPTGR